MQTATQIKKRNLQDNLLAKLRRSRMGVTMFLVNGFQIRGEIRGYDAFVVNWWSSSTATASSRWCTSTPSPPSSRSGP